LVRSRERERERGKGKDPFVLSPSTFNNEETLTKTRSKSFQSFSVLELEKSPKNLPEHLVKNENGLALIECDSCTFTDVPAPREKKNVQFIQLKIFRFKCAGMRHLIMFQTTNGIILACRWKMNLKIVRDGLN